MGSDVQTGFEQAITKNEEAYSPAIAGAVAAAEAWLKAACAMAIKYPRDLDVVRQKLLKECERPTLAAVAFYSKPIGGTKITGLSIRFAESAIQCMGHIHTTTQTLAETDDFRKIELRVWDAVSMNSYADEFTIQKTIERKSIPKERMKEVIRTRANASGEVLYIIRAEEDDLLNKVNAAKSKALRNQGLRHVPGWLLDECKQVLRETASRKDAEDPDAAKRNLFDSFSELGVTADQLKKYLGHERPNLQPAELADLRQIYTAIKTGETTIQSVFEAREEAKKEETDKKGAEGLKQRLAGNGEKVTKEQATTLQKTAMDNGWKIAEWDKALNSHFGANSVITVPAGKYNDAMRLAQGQLL